MRPLTADFLNNEGEEHTGEPVDLEGKTVAELKSMLREQGLPVSGTKAQLVERLQGNSVDGNLLSLEEEVKGEADLAPTFLASSRMAFVAFATASGVVSHSCLRVIFPESVTTRRTVLPISDRTSASRLP